MKFCQGGDTLVQALAGDGREFEFDHIEPRGIFGGVMHLEAGGQRPGLSGGQVLVENGIGVGVEVILHQHSFLRPWVVGTQLLHKGSHESRNRKPR